MANRNVPLTVGFLLVGLVACSDASMQTRTGEAVEVFVEIERVELDTAVVATIGHINDVLVLEAQILVADRMSDRVLAFTRDGNFKGSVGRRGDAPGEFRTPHSLLEDRDGTILVAQFSPRLTRVSPSLELMNVYTADVQTSVGGLAMVGADLVLYQSPNLQPGDNFVIWDADKGIGESFDPRSPLVLDVPYWNAAWWTHIAVTDGRIIVADNMMYPFRLYTRDLQLTDTVGTAPPSWQQASKPELGQFAAPGQQGAQEWLRSFTRIDGLHVVDDHWLVVTHRRRVNQYPSDDVILADVYQVEPSFTKVWEDIPMPGPVLDGGSCIWTIVAEPPEPWTIACWEPRPTD